MNDFECLSYMSYIYMRKHHKEDSSGWGISFRKSSVRGSIPKDSSVRGSNPRWKDTFSIDEKGERFIRCKGKCLEKEHRGMVPGGAMVTGGA
jgi:hypothetical protein